MRLPTTSIPQETSTAGHRGRPSLKLCQHVLTDMEMRSFSASVALPAKPQAISSYGMFFFSYIVQNRTCLLKAVLSVFWIMYKGYKFIRVQVNKWK